MTKFFFETRVARSTGGVTWRSHDIFFYLCFYLHLFNVIKFFFFDSWGFR